jgi:hypothetical protein
MFGYRSMVATDTKSGGHQFTDAIVGTSSRFSISHKSQQCNFKVLPKDL